MTLTVLNKDFYRVEEISYRFQTDKFQIIWRIFKDNYFNSDKTYKLKIHVVFGAYQKELYSSEWFWSILEWEREMIDIVNQFKLESFVGNQD